MSLFVHSTHLHPHIQLIAQKKVALKKAVKDGRVKLKDIPNPRKRPRGQTRGQTRLVACQPPDDIDLRTAFVVAIAGVYCRELTLVRGTLA